MEKKLIVYAGIVINSEQDIAKLLLKNPDHCSDPFRITGLKA